MRIVFSGILTAVLFMLPGTARATNATSFSALDLRNMCVSTSNVDYGYCAGYISAIAHTLAQQNVGTHRACNIGRVRSQQLVDTFNTWAEMFPDKLPETADTAVAAALARAFPCKSAAARVTKPDTDLLPKF